MISIEQLSGVGDALKELRWHARMKQIEVCRATGMTAPQVSRYENGHEMPTVESLVKYLIAVEADLCDLQRVLVTGQAPQRGRPAGREPADERPGAVELARDDADDRLDANPKLRQVVGSLLTLNLEGMERLEHRMKSMEEWMEDLRKAGMEPRRVVK